MGDHRGLFVDGMKIHVMGVGGSGMQPIARLLHARGFTVTGDDRTASPALDELSKEGIQTYVGQSAETLRPSYQSCFGPVRSTGLLPAS